MSAATGNCPERPSVRRPTACSKRCRGSGPGPRARTSGRETRWSRRSPCGWTACRISARDDHGEEPCRRASLVVRSAQVGLVPDPGCGFRRDHDHRQRRARRRLGGVADRRCGGWRRLWRDHGGVPISAESSHRSAVADFSPEIVRTARRFVWRGAIPEDPLVRAATVRLIDHLLVQNRRWGTFALVVCALATVLYVALAVSSGSPWWWAAAAGFAGMLGFGVFGPRWLKRRADRMRPSG